MGDSLWVTRLYALVRSRGDARCLTCGGCNRSLLHLTLSLLALNAAVLPIHWMTLSKNGGAIMLCDLSGESRSVLVATLGNLPVSLCTLNKRGSRQN